MNKVKVLDCTLRDGGYCNNWEFGLENEKKIVSSLIEAGIDIIECGFLTNKVTYREGVSKFSTIKEVTTIIPSKQENKMFVCMINYGEYEIDDIPEYNDTLLCGFRVAFHKKDMINALEFCKSIQAKGYKVFVQAMVSVCYADEEFLDLIYRVNQIEPYAFYIVDSFGMMKRKNLLRLFFIVEHNLKESIFIGFHSHNNMQLAYSNAQTLVDIQTNRDIIIDSSIMGMGRGAGNLNSELFLDYLNDNVGGQYKLKPLLRVMDEVLNNFYRENYWGYSLSNYLSATYNTHPDYAGYLSDKNTLTIEDMDKIFSMMSEDKRINYDKSYIEELYLDYMKNGKISEVHKIEFEKKLENKLVLIIAPGKSSMDEQEKIIAYARRGDVISISVNFDYPVYDTDYIFLSNLRRLRELPEGKKSKMIVTSNIPIENVYIQTNYYDLLNESATVCDNAGMMLIQYLITLGVHHIALAGMDGYSHDNSENYANSQMKLVTRNNVLDDMNYGISKMLKKYSEEIKIEFLTTPRYLKIDTFDC